MTLASAYLFSPLHLCSKKRQQYFSSSTFAGGMMSFEMCKVSASVNMKILSFARLIGSARSERKWNERRQSLSCAESYWSEKRTHCNPAHGSCASRAKSVRDNCVFLSVQLVSQKPLAYPISHSGLCSHYCTHTQLRFNPAREMIALKPRALQRLAQRSLHTQPFLHNLI